ncbi:alkyl sulfatase dimerization domain-containing protein [Streptomyces sp. NPDC048527]|uniref:alkyl sulfatase dimerization domain-containing protein n=1 Tax=Streptomyces sp. NPDC048527 TaxID=3365568 RepID=UPI00371F394D
MVDTSVREYVNPYPHDAEQGERFFWSGGPVEVAPNTWYVALRSGVTAFETAEGLVLVDSGHSQPAPVMAEKLRVHTTAPVHTAVYTHGHLDHAYGLPAFLAEGQQRPRVVAHRAMQARFDRYEATGGYNTAINNRQFVGDIDANDRSAALTYTRPPIAPDTFYDEGLTLEVGGLTFELHHARGETDDHTWVFNRDHGVLCPGDLVIWAVPNAGNPQKVQRYPWEWSAALRAMAAKQPRTMCPGHGAPIIDDPGTIQRLLLETADYLDAIVEQTVAALNDGAPPHVDIVHRVAPPASDSPWLQPIYDEAEFIVRNVIRYFGGWYSGRPGELKPAPRSAVAEAVLELAGGAGPVLARAESAVAAGDLRLACHLADWAVEADPGNPRVREGAAQVYETRAEAETSLMAINIYRAAAKYARAGRPFC